MENISILNKEKCTGCMACKSICPKKCISIIKDEMGFDYPHIDSNNCIHCGLCSKCCPALYFNNKKKTFKDIVYGYINKDDEKWKNSSSGGAFISICESFEKLNNNSDYYGAAYDSNSYSIKHIKTDFNNINVIQKSKYVQSRCEVYDLICKSIKSGNKVVFCGTPCQNTALVNYLHLKNIDRSNVLLIDIICNGVGSPRTFYESIDIICDNKCINKDEIISINHRGKKKGILGYNSYYTEINTIKRKYLINKNNDFHIKLYSEKLNCRDSCELCQFANENRISDITIADFKKFYLYNNVKSNKNASVIICHSENGKKYVEQLRNNGLLLNTSFEIIQNINPQYYNGIGSKSLKKRLILKKCCKENEKNIVSKLPKDFFRKYSIKEKVSEIIPDPIREKIMVKISRRRIK